MTTADKVLAALQSYGLKKTGHDSYQCNSPLRPGSNSHAFSVKIADDGEHGAFHDFVSGEKGSLYDLATLLGLAPQEQGASFTPLKTYKGLADYAEQHGCPESYFRSAGWYEVIETGRPALAFKTASGVRYRFLDGEKPKFRHGSGYVPCWYGLERAVDMAEKTRKPLVLCNGEPSVITAYYYGIAACCVTSGGERDIPQRLMDDLKEQWQGEIIVALDCDSKGREAMPKLVRQLIGEGYNAWGVDLGGSGGFDLADFCKLWQAEAWEHLPALPPVQTGVRLGKSGRDLMRMEFPEVAWIIPDILPEGLSICAAKPKMGKSWLWLNVCLSVTAQGYALGKIRVPHCNALYLCLEDGERRLQKRIKELGYDYLTIPPDFEYDDTLPTLDNGAITLIEEWIKSKERANNRYNLIVIDTLVMVKKAQKRGVSIYDQDYDGLSGLRTMGQKHPGTGILLVHHTKKGDASDIYDLITGSTGLQGVVETEMVLYELQNQAWIEVKGKDVESQKIPIRFDKDTRQWIITEAKKQLSLSPERMEIIDFLGDVDHAGATEIANAIGKPYNNVLKNLNRMKDDGIITQPSRGVYMLAEAESITEIHDIMTCHEENNSSRTDEESLIMTCHDVMNLLDMVPPKEEHVYGRGD